MHKSSTLIISIFFLFILTTSVRAQEERVRILARGKYFDVYASPGLSGSAVRNKLQYWFMPHPDFVLEKRRSGDILAQTFDTLFLNVADILDIHSYNFKGRIYILADTKDLNAISFKFFQEKPLSGGFYVPQKKTIYITFDDLSLKVLSHEMAHALMVHYFVVPPSAKIQEILSGYVEFSLRKSMQSLP